MQSHIREYCDELQALETILQNRDKQILYMEEQHFQLLRQLEVHKCDNNNCTNYYLTSFENCQCQECMFCQFRQENEERDNVLSEIAHAEAQEAQHAASMEQHMQQQIEQRINDNSSTQNNE